MVSQCDSSNCNRISSEHKKIISAEEAKEVSIKTENATTSNIDMVEETSQQKQLKGLLTSVEKRDLTKVLPEMGESPAAPFCLSSALAMAANNECNDEMFPLQKKIKKTLKDDKDLTDLLPVPPSYVRSTKSSNDVLRSPTCVSDMGYHNDEELIELPDELLLDDTSVQESEDNQITSINEAEGTSIEQQHMLINGLMVKSLADTISLMSSMRQQSQKIQKQLQKLGVEPTPLFDMTTDLNMDENVVGGDSQNIFASWQPPPLIPPQLPHKRRRASGKETFPMKLHRLLIDLEQIEDGQSIATFFPDGTAFVIKDTVKFEEKVLKMYFPRMKNFSSFHRQLNLYDFERLGSFSPVGQAKGAYCHALFRRDQPAWSSLMRPTRIKGGSAGLQSK